ncbi:reverse transcriptase family protein [Haliscomenobacter hydrossis]|uniref:RNA-directed DNA polymerase n=1 Tax=Haliscomenobacter hydrossis (strain ATCC 27775 / DSM 1100 / LMG 10767 / O) TaxID=760192 RepID=F4L831_HALH1|nr:reverse transcriptase family protein [Haliscomenobacter hydrossis]AEE54539.1 hypothetical protein Halhy_6724 [Haliscomenobacter hydrossis DSM 1100]
MHALFKNEPDQLAQSLNWPDDYQDVIKKQNYHQFSMPKKDGTLRAITAPGNKLKFLQKTLSHAFQLTYLNKIPDCVHGYVPGDIHPEVGTRHILSNAQVHFGAKYLLNLDIDDFFPNLDSLRILDALRYWYPEMPQATQELLVGICCYNNQLPMGAPSSPVLSNMCVHQMDLALLTLCAQHQVTYSRYVDDMSFSSSSDNLLALEPALIEALQSFGFTINQAKRMHFGPEGPKIVTGLIMDETDITVNDTFLDNLNECIKEYSQLRWLSRQLEMDKKWLQSKVRFAAQSIEGQLAFLSQIQGADDAVYQKYHRKFDKAQSMRPPNYDFYF